MSFPPIKPDRCLVWISLRADATVEARHAALRAVLKACRLHPLDTTASAELVIVEEAAFETRRADVLAALGAGDVLHKIGTAGGRLIVDVLAPAGDSAARRPPWLRG
jgi:hypothetical protein